MAEYPDDCLYSKDHEWVRIEGTTGVVGITDYAQQSLGDVVYVELPSVNQTFDAGEAFGTVESVKAVSELFMPVAGQVTAVNTKLADSPELVNHDPYGDGWMVKIELTHPDETSHLMSASAYEAYVKAEASK
ncbi:MAG: glycine cleavage system protein GcvH [Acidobacteriota bacterium]|nr:glycine cleavage system protein GcvH [Blastocatellia bacterium]MDW8239607.1 glycine cleavage system protein GcvH [Acidobacteriota bacterium]